MFLHHYLSIILGTLIIASATPLASQAAAISSNDNNDDWQADELLMGTYTAVIDTIKEISGRVAALPEPFIKMVDEKLNGTKKPSDDLVFYVIDKTLLLCKDLVTAQEKKQLAAAKKALIDGLKAYVAQRYTYAIDPNMAVFLDHQNPTFTITFENPEGKTKTRTYKASINLIGLNLEWALRFNAIFFVGPALNFYDSNKTIQLGKGFEIFPAKIINFPRRLRGHIKYWGSEEYKKNSDILTKEKVVVEAAMVQEQRLINAINAKYPLLQKSLKWHGGSATFSKRTITDENDLKEIHKASAKQQELSAAFQKQTIAAHDAGIGHNPIPNILNFLGIQYIPFATMPGGMVVFTVPVGAHMLPSLFGYHHDTAIPINGFASLVTGGTLSPHEEG